jgi:hypothetical protein
MVPVALLSVRLHPNGMRINAFPRIHPNHACHGTAAPWQQPQCYCNTHVPSASQLLFTKTDAASHLDMLTASMRSVPSHPSTARQECILMLIAAGTHASAGSQSHQCSHCGSETSSQQPASQARAPPFCSQASTSHGRRSMWEPPACRSEPTAPPATCGPGATGGGSTTSALPGRTRWTPPS